MKKVLIIIGSVRPKRVGLQIGEWMAGALGDVPGIDFELLDLRDWSLPMDDEPNQPKRMDGPQYDQDHTLAFSQKVHGADGFVLITPQYNWGYPAALKNALDHLYYEWTGKPVTVVSYGARGGAKAADQLREVIKGLGMEAVGVFPAISIKDMDKDDDLLIKDPPAAFAPYKDAVLDSVFALARALGPAA